MFGLKRKAKAKAQTQTFDASAPAPKSFQVWYKDSVGRWMHASTHTVRSDANAAVRCFTISQTEIREIY